jgi:hypothetical protein
MSTVSNPHAASLSIIAFPVFSQVFFRFAPCFVGATRAFSSFSLDIAVYFPQITMQFGIRAPAIPGVAGSGTPTT